MREGKPDVLVMEKPLKHNQIETRFKSWVDKQKQKPLKYDEIEPRFKSWLAKQSLPVEAAVVGAAIGGVFCTVKKAISSIRQPPGASITLHQPKASDFAILMGVNEGILCALKRLRGKEDVYLSMVAGFGSGAILSLVNAPNQASSAVFNGVVIALANGGGYKLGDLVEESSKPRVEDDLYKETRGMLTSLGLEHYEKNFKRGLLKDTTLPMLTDSLLQEVRIPPGARLLILDHTKGRRV